MDIFGIAPKETHEKMKTFHLPILSRDLLTTDTFVLHCERPKDFSFIAGQHICVTLFDTERRYSIISGEQEEIISLLIKQIKGGRVSAALKEIPLQTKLKVGLAEGYFIYKRTHRKSVFVATGTGIAPFLSMLRSGISPYLLLQGASRYEELYFEEILEMHATNYQKCLSKGEAPKKRSNHSFYQGHVTDFIQRQLAPGSYDFYLCGLREMITEVTHLVDECFPESNIYKEGFN